MLILRSSACRRLSKLAYRRIGPVSRAFFAARPPTVRMQQKLLTQCIAEETPESRGGWKQVRHPTLAALCMGSGEHGIPTKLLKTL